MMIPRSATILSKNTGIVILVGKAARFVTSAAPMAVMASANIIMLLPELSTANTVIGVRTQP